MPNRSRFSSFCIRSKSLSTSSLQRQGIGMKWPYGWVPPSFSPSGFPWRAGANRSEARIWANSVTAMAPTFPECNEGDIRKTLTAFSSCRFRRSSTMRSTHEQITSIASWKKPNAKERLVGELSEVTREFWPPKNLLTVLLTIARKPACFCPQVARPERHKKSLRG